MRLEDHAVAITGAGGGIGRAVALAFAAEGAGVVAADLGERADAVAEEVRRAGGRAVAVRADVSRSADMRALVERSVREFGGLDVLVTCAGLGTAGLLLEQDESEWTRVIDVNRSEEHTSELQSQSNLVCRLLLEKKKQDRHHARAHPSQGAHWDRVAIRHADVRGRASGDAAQAGPEHHRRHLLLCAGTSYLGRSH